MKYIAIHHTAVGGPKSQLYAVNNYHRDKWNMQSSRGWFVGYNYFIDNDGTQTLCRAIGEETVANKGHNCDVPKRCDTISVCLAGNFNETLPTKPQVRKVKTLIQTLRKAYPTIKTVGHRDLQAGRTCPGKLISKTYLEELVEKVPQADLDKERIEEYQSVLARAKAQLLKILALLQR